MSMQRLNGENLAVPPCLMLNIEQKKQDNFQTPTVLFSRVLVFMSLNFTFLSKDMRTLNLVTATCLR